MADDPENRGGGIVSAIVEGLISAIVEATPDLINQLGVDAAARELERIDQALADGRLSLVQHRRALQDLQRKTDAALAGAAKHDPNPGGGEDGEG